jgi:YggT family protein
MTVGDAIYIITQLFALLILARVLMSWVRVDPYHPVAQFIYNTTEPFLRPVREALPPVGGLDFSPIVVLILVQVIGEILRQALAG